MVAYWSSVLEQQQENYVISGEDLSIYKLVPDRLSPVTLEEAFKGSSFSVLLKSCRTRMHTDLALRSVLNLTLNQAMVQKGEFLAATAQLYLHIGSHIEASICIFTFDHVLLKRSRSRSCIFSVLISQKLVHVVLHGFLPVRCLFLFSLNFIFRDLDLDPSCLPIKMK